MPQFAYQAVDPSGKETSGTMEAADRGAAMRNLTTKGLQPFKVSEVAVKAAGKGAEAKTAKASAKSNAMQPPVGPMKLSGAQVQMFTEELSELLEAGMRLEPALKILEGKGESRKVPFRRVAHRIGDLVREGRAFHDALRLASPSFGDLFSSVAAAGEASGTLASALKRQSAYLTASREMKGKVAIAMIYPAFLALAGAAVMILFVTFLIPKLMQLVKSTRGTMPKAAEFLMGLNAFLKNNWIVMLLIVLVVVIAFTIWVRTKEGRMQWDELKLKIPFVGNVLSSSFHSQFLETLASLGAGGLPLLKGMELALRVTSNVYAQAQLTKAIDVVRDGGALSRSLERTTLFPDNLIEMVRLGEQIGDLPGALRRAADRCAKQLSRALEALAALIQPVIIFVLAAVVGLIAWLMISIIFDTVTNLKR
ncbi:MAG: type II secretion system F family protein [Verrucomicrobiaceae bacterium]|nr:type II secretion system F family protein [Verrucomicrobiaceae bacterium]